MPPDIIVIGCVSRKRESASMARDLYTSALFGRRRRYAERSGIQWVIFSAKHGMVDPAAVIEPYDVSLLSLPVAKARALGEQGAHDLERRLGTLAGKTIEVHAGSAYVDALESGVSRRGGSIAWPLRGLRLGEQLHWYDAHDGRATGEVGMSHARSTVAELDPIGEVAIVGLQRLGSFDFRWPTGTDTFERGWEMVVSAGGRAHQVRHGIGRRIAYGRERARTVTWVSGWAKVEGAATDDYADTGMLVSLLRVESGRMVDYQDELPAGYAGFELVRYADEIVAPYSRRKLAVKLTEDDLLGWARHALLRAAAQARRAPATKAPSPEPIAPRLAPAPSPNQRAVADALLAYGATSPMDDADDEPSFTENPEANRLVSTDPYAFLLAVIFDQGIKAERAWAAPYLLRERLGHLDPGRMAAEPERVAAAVSKSPTLHRYTEKMPGWLVSAARRVLADYGGDASRIWGDEPTAIELQRRLDAFRGIGQKKAAMAVAILARDLRKPIGELGGNDVAYDVHIRRVFLRTGLVDRDDIDEMVAKARALHPAQPAMLDLPAWVIGRTWCRPGVPTCPECPLLPVCPRLIQHAAQVYGA